MASFLGEIGRVAQTDFNTPASQTVTVGGTIPAGSRVAAIIGSGVSHAGGPGVVVSDTQGNTWAGVESDPNYGGTPYYLAHVTVIHSLLAHALSSGDVITLTYDTNAVFPITASAVIVAFTPDAPGTSAADRAVGLANTGTFVLGAAPRNLTQGAVVVGSFAVEGAIPSVSHPFTALGSQNLNGTSSPGRTWYTPASHAPFWAIVPPGSYAPSITVDGTQASWSGLVVYWVGAYVPPSLGRPWNIHTEFQQYQHAYVSTGGVVHYASVDGPAPPFQWDVVVATPPSGATDGEPRMVRDWLARTWLLFTRLGGPAPGVYSVVSDDEGRTWSTPVLAFANGKHPDIAPDLRTGQILRTCYFAANLIGTLTDASGATSPQFTLKDQTGANLVPDDDTFHIAPAPDGPGRWLLVMVVAGTIQDWASADDGRTWVRVN